MLTPADTAGDVKFTLANLPLRAFTAYMPPTPGLNIRSGSAGASGQLHFQGGDVSALRFRGDAAIDNFNIQETTQQSAVRLESFSLAAIDYQKDRVEIGRAIWFVLWAGSPFLPTPFQLHILDGSACGRARNRNRHPIQAASSADTPPAKPALTYKVKRLDISRGTMDLPTIRSSRTSRRVSTSCRARFEHLQPAGRSRHDRSYGAGDRPLFARHHRRHHEPAGYDRRTDMHLAFRNIELPVFNPYSGRYAGYAIAKGKLTTELAYKIDNRTLKADHHVIINQLEWAWRPTARTSSVADKVGDGAAEGQGRRHRSGRASDRSLDDPKFRIGPIIWQIIGNILEKSSPRRSR